MQEDERVVSGQDFLAFANTFSFNSATALLRQELRPQLRDYRARNARQQAFRICGVYRRNCVVIRRG